MKNALKKIWLMVLFLWAFCLPIFVSAQGNVPDVDGFQIIPELEGSEMTKVQEATDDIGEEPGKVMENYRGRAEELSTEQQLASWIMNWDTIVNYLAYVIKFISQLWLTVWVVFIMIAWYKYMVSVFNWQKTWKDHVKNAIIWVIIVIFSYAIMKIMTSLVWLS